jgi:hypothetical protein
MAIRIDKTEDKGIMLYHDNSPIARYYMKRDDAIYPERQGNVLVMEVKDTGDSCFQFAMEVFKMLRSGAVDQLPLIW